MNDIHQAERQVDRAPTVHGRCPGALRPMMSGDGLVMRLRPRLARLTAGQVLLICDAARGHGAGVVDVTNRANLQVRGVAEADWSMLLDRFGQAGLLDESADIEARRNVLVAPDWRDGDDNVRVASELMERLGELPPLPAKVGFAIDAGPAPCLLNDSADFRVERAECGGLVLRADGRLQGVATDVDRAVDDLIALARWFVDSGGLVAGRMARHQAALPAWAQGRCRPAAAARLATGFHPLGWVLGLPFGQIEASRLADAIIQSGASALRLTPWRRVLFEGASTGLESVYGADSPDVDGLADAGWQVESCAGAPFCPQATVETRNLALRLMRLAAQGALRVPGASSVNRVIHVSGCAKGCAYADKSSISVIGRGGAYDLTCAEDSVTESRHAGLSADEIVIHLECC